MSYVYKNPFTKCNISTNGKTFKQLIAHGVIEKKGDNEYATNMHMVTMENAKKIYGVKIPKKFKESPISENKTVKKVVGKTTKKVVSKRQKSKVKKLSKREQLLAQLQALDGNKNEENSEENGEEDDECVTEIE